MFGSSGSDVKNKKRCILRPSAWLYIQHVVHGLEDDQCDQPHLADTGWKYFQSRSEWNDTVIRWSLHVHGCTCPHVANHTRAGLGGLCTRGHKVDNKQHVTVFHTGSYHGLARSMTMIPVQCGPRGGQTLDRHTKANTLIRSKWHKHTTMTIVPYFTPISNRSQPI